MRRACTQRWKRTVARFKLLLIYIKSTTQSLISFTACSATVFVFNCLSPVRCGTGQPMASHSLRHGIVYWCTVCVLAVLRQLASYALFMLNKAIIITKRHLFSLEPSRDRTTLHNAMDAAHAISLGNHSPLVASSEQFAFGFLFLSLSLCVRLSVAQLFPSSSVFCGASECNLVHDSPLACSTFLVWPVLLSVLTSRARCNSIVVFFHVRQASEGNGVPCACAYAVTETKTVIAQRH